MYNLFEAFPMILRSEDGPANLECDSGVAAVASAACGSWAVMDQQAKSGLTGETGAQILLLRQP